MKLKYLFLFVFFVLIYLIIAPVFKYSRPIWPPIKNPEILLQDAKNIMLSTTNRLLADRSLWPDSITILKPKSVLNEGDHLELIISGGGINAAWGYIIFPDHTNFSSHSLMGLRFKGSVYPGIYKFETIE